MKTDSRLSSRTPTAHSTDKERGAALVEFSLVIGLLFVIMFGIFEMGTAWSKSQLVTQAARTGARAGSQLGINAQSDEFIVQSVEAGLGDSSANVTRIVIYQATVPSGDMPPACVTAAKPGVAGLCSVYDASDYGNYGAWIQGAWTPASRSNDSVAPDYLGVRVEISEPMLTGFFGGGAFDINDTTIMRIEPDAGNP